MERHVYESFQEITLEKAIHAYQGTMQDVQKLTESESLVYAFSSNGRPLILRITPDSHRTQSEIEAEMEWIHRLRSSGIQAAAPVVSQDGSFIHSIPGVHMNFHVVAFERANGHSPEARDWTLEFIETWGQFVGAMHRVGFEAENAGIQLNRPTWDEEYNVRSINVIAKQPKVVARQREYVQYMRSLPRDPDGYGMIHSDFETENFFIDNQGTITAFDFDESQYNWYVYDIATIVRQASWILSNLPSSKTLPSITLQNFYDLFMDGYASQHTLSSFWIHQIPRFVQWREICMYVFSHGKQNTSAWTVEQKAYFSRVKERIEHDVPAFHLNYGG